MGVYLPVFAIYPDLPLPVEFFACNGDAGLEKFIGLDAPVTQGLQPIKVLLRNQGINSLTSVNKIGRAHV